jgi:site-specific recombinase XerD
MTMTICPNCARVLSELVAGTNVSAKNETTLGDAIKELIRAKIQSGRRARYIQGLRIYLNQFSRGRESMPLRSVDIDVLEAWFLIRNEKPNSKRSNMGRLSALFAFAIRRGWINANPCHRLEKPFVDQNAPRIMTIEQCQKALCWARDVKPQFLAWFSLALLVGLRPDAEADKVRWENIDLVNKRLTISGASTKVRQHRIVDLSMTPAVPWLERSKELKSPLDLCAKARRRYLRMLRDYLGEWPQDWCRHSAASYLLQHHQDAGKVAMLLGNPRTPPDLCL